MPPPTLRPYQQEALTALLTAPQRGVTRPVVALPTGAGKTILFCALIAQRPGRVLVLCHRDELLTQARAKLLEWMPQAHIGLVKGQDNETDATIVLASIQTLVRPERLRQMAQTWAVVIADEAHHALVDCEGQGNGWVRVLDHVAPAPTLCAGFTATPFRPDGQSIVGPGCAFQEIVYTRHLLEMIEAGYLVMPTAIRLRLAGMHLKGIARVAGDYSAKALETRMLSDAVRAPEHLAAGIVQHASGRRIIAFSPGIEMAEQLTAQCAIHGLRAATIVGDTDADTRHAASAKLAAGDLDVLSSVMVLTEGFDLPEVDGILLARATRSKVLYQQAVGRGLRLSPHTGKTDCLILDATGATERNNLFSMAEMLGLVTPVAASSGADEDDAEETPEEAAKNDAETSDLRATIMSATVRLLRRSVYRWIQTRRGAWVLSMPDQGMLRVTMLPANQAKLELRRNGQWRVLIRHITPAHAFGIGEDTARAAKAPALQMKEADWLRRAPSPKQIALARRLGIAAPETQTRGALSEAITAVIGDW